MNQFEAIQQRRDQLKKLVDQINTLERYRNDLRDNIAAYKAFRPEIENQDIDNLKRTAELLSKKVGDQNNQKARLERALQEVNSTRVMPLIVWKYFSAEQTQIRSKASQIKAELSLLLRDLTSNQESLANVHSELEAAQKRVQEHANFDLNVSEQRLFSLETKIKHLKDDYNAKSSQLAWIEKKIAPHTQELNRLYSKHINLNNEIAAAEQLDRELSSASNSYERAKIHEKCEIHFGNGRPSQVVNERRKIIRGIESDINKLNRRVQEEIQKLERTITHLLIDGNNMCYEGQKFIGLRAISALVRELGDRYKITAVFDASIRAMLKTDNQGIQSVLGNSVNTHVSPTKTKADEYLLKLAADSETAYILSNDRFAEYHDYAAVTSRRVLRFLIAEGKLVVNDMDVSVSL